MKDESSSIVKEIGDLTKKVCKPCEGYEKPMSLNIKNRKAITKEFVFKDFKEALVFVNKVGEIAEREGHHPDINLHEYKKVMVTLWTHAINGLSENDFIEAAKIDELNLY